MMKYIYTIIIVSLFLGCSATSNSQNLKTSLKEDLVDLFIKKNEIQKTEKEKFINNFEQLVTILELNNSSKFSHNKDGLYKVALNVSHTKAYLLINFKSNYNILDTEDLTKAIFEIISYLEKKSDLSKEEVVKYFTALAILSKSNEQIKKINTLEKTPNK